MAHGSITLKLRLQDFQGEHDRLLELQKMPAQQKPKCVLESSIRKLAWYGCILSNPSWTRLEVEADRLRSIIQAKELGERGRDGSA